MNMDALGTKAEEAQDAAAEGALDVVAEDILDIPAEPERDNTQRVAVSVHAFYANIFKDMIPKLKALPDYCDLFVTCVEGNADDVCALLKEAELPAEVLVVENLGMDVLPFVRAAVHFRFASYLAVVKLHTKNNKTDLTAVLGAHIMRRMVGDVASFDAVYKLFLDNPQLCLAGPNDTFKHCHYMMYNNRTSYGALCELFGVPFNTNVGFFAGTMFWIRGSVLSFPAGVVDKLAEMAAEDGGVELAKTGRDGSVAHALERIWGALVPLPDPDVAVLYRKDFSDVASVVRVGRQSRLLREPLRRMGVSEHIMRHQNVARDSGVIQRTQFFDAPYYASRWRDLPNPGVNPALHYMLYGDLFGRNPSDGFNTVYYHLKRPDVVRKNINVLVHYVQHGQREREVVAPTDADWLSVAKKYKLFDEEFYDAQYTYSRQMYKNSAEHYLEVGMFLGCQPSRDLHLDGSLGLRPSPARSLPDYMENYFDREYIRYCELVRVAENNDSSLLDELVESVESEFGESGTTLIAHAIADVAARRWEGARERLQKFWDLMGAKTLPIRHFRHLASRMRQFSTGAGVLEFDPGALDDRGQRFCVYTTLFGDIDSLPPMTAFDDGIDFICFTDRDISAPGWTIRKMAAEIGDPNLDAKVYKVLPHRYLADYDGSLFVDANSFVHGRLNHLVRAYLAPHDFVMWSHPERSDVYTEAVAIVEALRHPPDVIVSQVEHYSDDGLPRNSGLFEASFIWRRHRSEELCALMDSWWEEIRSWSKRDQLSLGYLTWKTGIKPRILPSELGTARANEYFTKLPHLRLPHEVSAEVVDDAGPVPATAPRTRVWVLYGSTLVQTGSTVLRGYQVSEILRSVLSEDVEIGYSSVDIARDSVVWVTKSYFAQHGVAGLQRLKERNNAVLLDNVDGRLPPNIADYVDGLIACSLEAFRQYRMRWPETPAFHVTHHVDLRIAELIAPPTDRLRIGYFGELVNTRSTPKIQEVVDLVGVDTSKKDIDWLGRLFDYNCHYIIRNSRGIDGNKPFLKGFVAARCGAPVIAERDTGDANYYLGTDYPFLVPAKAELEVIEDMVEHVAAAYGGSEWLRALEVMAEVRERSSLATVKRELDFMFRQFLSPRRMAGAPAGRVELDLA